MEMLMTVMIVEIIVTMSMVIVTVPVVIVAMTVVLRNRSWNLLQQTQQHRHADRKKKQSNSRRTTFLCAANRIHRISEIVD